MLPAGAAAAQDSRVQDTSPFGFVLTVRYRSVCRDGNSRNEAKITVQLVKQRALSVVRRLQVESDRSLWVGLISVRTGS